MMTRKQLKGDELQDLQNGAASAWKARGDKRDTGKNPPKTPKAQGKEVPKDMVYYAQKLNSLTDRPSDEGLDATPDIFHALIPGPSSVQASQQPSAQTTPEVHAGEGEDEEGAEQPTLAQILKAVNKCTASVQTLQQHFGGLKEEVGLIRHDFQKIRERTTAVESRVSEVEDRMAPLIRELQVTARTAIANENRNEDIENRLRRSNIRIVGLPEKAEGRDPTAFVEAWLQEVFGKDVFTPFYSVERAHRVPPRPLPPGNPPRTMLAKLLNFKDKEIILRLARERRNIQFNGVRVSFYPDFSAEVQRRRAKFGEVKRRLQRLRAMLYPAKLRIIAGGRAQFFESAADASSWLDMNEHLIRQAERPEADAD